MNAPRGEDPKALLQSYMDELLTAPETEVADPREEQRERLQKLLYSAAPHQRRTARAIPDPVVVEPKGETASPTRLWHRGSEPVAKTVTPEPPPAPKSSPVDDEIGKAGIDTDRAGTDASAPEMAATAFRMKDVEWLANGRPAWAQERFDVLLFKVSGLTLAVPLIALGQIQPLTDELTPLFGQIDWFMGLLPTPTGKIRTVNTAKFVMPERYDERFVETAQYVISIDGVPWGLAVDSVNQPIRLDPDDVKWRTERSHRPWLAGTVKEHMCALLDIPKVGQLLMEADRQRA